MSISTNLVTLSVHDSYTFEGVEIAINPDVFFHGTAGSLGPSAQHTRNPSYASTSTPFGSAIAPPSAAVAGHVEYKITTTTVANSNHNIGGGGPNQDDGSTTGKSVDSSDNKLISAMFQPGDIIEIKVWDKKTHVHQDKHNKSSLQQSHKQQVHRRGGSMATVSTSSGGTMIKNNTHHHETILTRAASKLQQQQQQQIMTSSAASSVYHPLSDPNMKGSNNAKSSSNTTAASTTTSRPPIVPRNTSNATISSSAAVSPKYISTSPKTPPKTNYFSFKATPSNSTDAVVQQEDSLNTSNHLPSASLLPPKRTLDGSFSEEEVGVDVEEEASSSSVQDGSLMGVDVSLSSSVASQIPMPNTGMDGKDSLSGSGRNVDNGMVASGLTTVDSVDSDSMIVSEPNSSRIESSGGGGGGVGGGLHSRMSSLGSPGSNVATVVCDDDFLLPSSWNDPLEEIARTHTLRLSFVTSITAKSLMALKPGGRTKISMLKKVADLYELSTYDMVTITKFSKEEEAKVQASCQADFVTMTIKDQFMSRGEMYEFQKSFLGKWIYAGERLCTNDGIRGTVMEIRNKTEEFKSGFITEDTKITCRSRSARIIYLVQISMEMWDYASPYEGGEKHAQYGDGECEIYFDKYVSFMFKLFEEWKKLETSHSLTVVFFSRTFVNQSKSTNNTIRSSASDIFKLQKDVDGRLFEDHFKVVIENATRTELESLVTTIKKAFIRYPSEVGWALTKDYSRLPSFAAQGNILEAINTALNMLQLHFVDRDLHRCGNSIVVVSAGSGVFEVDKGLAGITKQRMMDNGIGSDMLSLGLPPLHVAPFMLFKESKGSHKNQSNDTDDFDNDWRAYFEIPHWMHLSFVNYDRVTPKRPDSDEAIPDDDIDDDGPKFKTFSNGFIYHEKGPSHRLHRTRIAKGTSVVKQQQKHLVLGRNFEDILEACRPRNKGSYSGGTPPALISQLKMFDLIGDKKSNEGSSAFDQQPSDTPREWNSIYLGNPKSSPCPSLSSSVDASGKFNRNESSSELSTYSTTPSSVFASNLSMILGRSPGNIHHGSPSLNHIQIQQHSSSDMPLEIISNDIGGGIRRSNSQGTIENIDEPPSRKGSRSDSIISSSGSNGSTSYTNGKILSLDAMREAMERFDEQLFLHESETRDVEVKRQNDVNKTLKPDRDNYDNIVSTAAPSQSYSKSRIGGGIGAAISEFESKPTTSQAFPTNRRNESFTVTRLKKSMNAVSSNNLWSGHAFSRPSSLAYSFDDNHLGTGGIGLSVSRHAVSNLSHSSKPSLFLPMISGSSVPSKASFDDNFSPIRVSPPTVKEITVPLANYESKKRSPHRERKIVPKSKAQQTITRVQRGPPPSHHNRRKQWVLNPFRQEDEEEVLAKRTHNSRRWSHVFPEGEIEFKRHAGPNWKSLCQPAILPVTIDVHPTPQELNDQSKYSFNHYQLNLDAMDLTYYTSHSELLMEMVRQRIVQDFQLVPQSVLDRNRKEADHGLEITKPRTLPLDTKINTYDANVGASGRIKGSSPTNANGKIQHVLSMGHRFHIISCNPTSDCVDVVQYLAKNAYNNEYNTFTYNYNIWMPATQRYLKVSQTFQRFPEEYPWNRLDNLICGDTDKTLDDQTKYRRIAFCIIPDHFSNESGEDALLKKIHRFIEFLEKIAKKDLNIQVVSSGHNSRSVEKIAPKDNQMKFIIHNRKKDKYEWIEVAASAIFDTRKSFRIIFKWLVSSAIKVDAQVQALQRRCSQYGLQLVEVPEISVRSNVFLNPLRYPESISVPTPEKAIEIENALVHKFRFCDDGKYPVFPKDAEKIFGVKLAVNSRASAWKRVLAQQYIHRSGTLFVRLLRDIQQQSVTFIFIENRRLIGNSKQMLDSARCIFGEINQFISDLCKLDVAT